MTRLHFLRDRQSACASNASPMRAAAIESGTLTGSVVRATRGLLGRLLGAAAFAFALLGFNDAQEFVTRRAADGGQLLLGDRLVVLAPPWQDGEMGRVEIVVHATESSTSRVTGQSEPAGESSAEGRVS